MTYWKYSFIIIILIFGACHAPTPRIDRVLGPDPASEIQEAVEAESAPCGEEPADIAEQGMEAGGTDSAVVVEPQLPLSFFYTGDFPLTSHPRVDKYLNYYTGSGRATFSLWLERASRYIPSIQEVFREEGIPLDLAYLALIESGFNMRAYSWAHAAGPWQFIESTGKLYGLKNDWWQDGRLDIEKSTLAAARHLKTLHDRFDGDWYLAVAAYNAGGGTVNKAIRKSDSRDFWELTEGSVLREETCDYLPKLIATLTLVKDPETYGFADIEMQEPFAYDTVVMESTTDLELIAEFCGVSYGEIKELNPELKRWCTPPGETGYRLRVPVGTADQVMDAYAQLPADQRARYARHQIKAGDTLQVLARRYKIRVDDIISLNQIKNPKALQIGQNLILPLKEGYTSLPADALAESYIKSRRKTYKVRKGDSLWSIARRFEVTEKELRIWNKLGWSNTLQPGQTLVVSKMATAKTTARVASAVKKGPTRKMIYQVVPGDTLWGIGRQFDVATEEIRQWNELSRGHVLKPGQKLTLMVASDFQG